MMLAVPCVAHACDAARLIGVDLLLLTGLRPTTWFCEICRDVKIFVQGSAGGPDLADGGPKACCIPCHSLSGRPVVASQPQPLVSTDCGIGSAPQDHGLP